MTNITFTKDRMPPVNVFVMGIFPSMYRSQKFHVCDCRWDGKHWKMHGNDNVRDYFTRDPFAWAELPTIPDMEWTDD